MIEPKIPKNEVERLEELISLNLSEAEKKDQLDEIVDLLSNILDFPIAYISTIESSTQNIHSSCGLNVTSSKRSTSFCGHTILQKDVLIIEDTLKDERFHDNPMVENEPNIRFYAGYPLSTLLGHNIGSLCIADKVPRKLSESELRTFKMVGKLLNERIRMFKLGGVQKKIQETKDQLEQLNVELSESNKFFKQLFGQYMSDTLLEKVLVDKKETALGGEEKYVTVLMSDLRSFSPLSEKYSAEVIVEILNIYFEEMINIIQQYDGFINEILGDGILVIFGAPNNMADSELQAVKCAREMQQGIKRVNKKLRIKDLPVLQMGIGINSGNLVVGNIGSKKRMKYGVVGENINIAARIESLTIPDQILISEATYLKVANQFPNIGHIRTKIKGFKKSVTIYDVSEI